MTESARSWNGDRETSRAYPTTGDRPLVSCLMPTTNARRAFLPQAIRYFLRQDYPNKELLVIDDGAEPVRVLVPESDLVRYVHLPGRRPLGAKRNQACELAAGEILAHWDDDDWHAPWRLSYQVEQLRRLGVELCGLDRLWFYEPGEDRAWQYVYPAGSCEWLAGGTLCFTRPLWQRHPFPEVTIGEDNRFVSSVRSNRMAALGDIDFYVALIHPHNTSRKHTTGRRWYPGSSTRVHEILGADHAFYARLGGQSTGVREPAAAVAAGSPQRELTSSRRAPAPTLSPETDPANMAPAVTRRAVDRSEATRSSRISIRPENRSTLMSTADANHRPVPGDGLREPTNESSADTPLVSCIMATGNRQDFLRQAIKYFQRQTHDEKELVLIDDGAEPSAEIVPEDERIKYIRLESRTNLGKKLNLGIESSTGSIIQKLDDDDYYHPEFLTSTVAALLPHEPTSAIVGLDCFLVLLADTGELKFSGHGYCAGPTLCFFRRLWEKKLFRDVPRAVDYYFLKDHKARRVKVKDPELVILVRHGLDHLWTKVGKTDVNDYYRRQPTYSKTLRQCVAAEDLAFYESLRTNRSAGRDRIAIGGYATDDLVDCARAHHPRSEPTPRRHPRRRMLRRR